MLKRVCSLCFFLLVAWFLALVTAQAETTDKSESAMASVDMLVGTCVACHGMQGNSTGPATPSIAGFTYGYLLSVLLAYKHDDDMEALEKIINEAGDDENDEIQDLEPLKRYGTIMARISKGYSLAELKTIARYFSEQPFRPAAQEYDADMAMMGGKLHEAKCDKCHEDGGRSPEDDVAILAGQWSDYLRYTLIDYHSGTRDMPKKMKSKLEEVWEDYPKEGIEALIQYYASMQK